MSTGLLTTLVLGYLRDVAEHVPAMAAAGQGLEVLGLVPGRPETEDVELAIDRACDDLLDTWVRQSGLGIEVHSEHGVRRPDGGKGPPEYLITIDPFDGTGLYRRGLPAEWWSVLSVLRAGEGGEGTHGEAQGRRGDGRRLGIGRGGELKAVCAGAVDILRREVYFADGAGAWMSPLEGGEQRALRPSRMTALAEGPTIAAYLMDPAYLGKWTDRAARLIETLTRRHPKVRIWPNGGSCVYPWMARGLVQAYLMFDEPCSEIDPGIGFARLAGFPLCTANGGGLIPYRSELSTPGRREALFIAACTEQLASEIAGLVGLTAR